MPGSSSVRTFLGCGTEDFESNPDWPRLNKERLSGLVVDHMLRNGHTPPKLALASFKQNIGFQMRCRNALKRIGERAERLGLPVLTFKGCALAFGSFPRLGLRDFSDIDLAVPAQRLPEIRNILSKLGFYTIGHDQFSSAGVHIDLHVHPLHQLATLIGPKVQEWWEAAVPLSPDIGGVLRLNSEHEFVLGLMHGAKHSFSRGNWLVDLAFLATHVESQSLRATIQRFKAERQLAYAARCLEAWFAIKFPGSLEAAHYERLNFLERRFVGLVLDRRAPDFLGMLTPLTSASNSFAAMSYLRRTLYPPGIDFRERTGQLFQMAWSVLSGRI